ncbi:MAG: arylamine N-acetyltransferase family protein, partial [Aggregatilineales bacterium]
MNLQAYFDRINYQGTTEPTYKTLCGLYQAHLNAIPFENLNIHMPKPIVLSEDALFQKIIHENRGGFCFEQNGFFALALQQLGFEVTMLEANVYSPEKDAYSMPFAHLTLLVPIDGVRYLVDVGFASAPYGQPLELDNSDVQERENGRFKITMEDDVAYYQEYLNGSDDWMVRYRFFFTPRSWDDFTDACEFMQTSPKVHFTQRRLCTQFRDGARLTLTDNKFIRTTLSGERT